MSPDEIREQLGAWLDEHWSPEHELKTWRSQLLEAGWAAPHWPADSFGRGFDKDQMSVVEAVFRERGVIGAAQVGPRRLAA